MQKKWKVYSGLCRYPPSPLPRSERARRAREEGAQRARSRDARYWTSAHEAPALQAGRGIPSGARLLFTFSSSLPWPFLLLVFPTSSHRLALSLSSSAPPLRSLSSPPSYLPIPSFGFMFGITPIPLALVPSPLSPYSIRSSSPCVPFFFSAFPVRPTYPLFLSFAFPPTVPSVPSSISIRCRVLLVLASLIMLTSHQPRQRTKRYPHFRAFLAGGTRLAYGACALTEGGR
ncbi:hypothetical protein K438DRAFT_248501 [Mycena galopus ATCC 62051]|nr:hypothetical protein K438DRAFT_248501 [Mycena galopus ATCC 62051]